MDIRTLIDDCGNDEVCEYLSGVWEWASLPFPYANRGSLPRNVDDVLRPIVGFGNCIDGGALVFSAPPIRESHKEWDRIEETLERLIEQARKRIAPTAPNTRIVRDDILCALLVESISRRVGLCYDRELGDRDGVYLAYDDGSFSPDEEDLEMLRDRAGLADAESRSVSEKFDSVIDSDALESAGFSVSNLEQLRSANIITAEGELTMAGAVAFGAESLIERFPALGIVVRRFAGGAEECIARNLDPMSEELVRGPATKVEPLSAELASWLPVTDPGDNGVTVFREILVNAIGHRSLLVENFEDRTNAVTVSVYDDQVRVISPGAIPRGRVRPSDRDRLHGRFSRNPNLILFLKAMGLARQTGLGLAKVRAAVPMVGCHLELIDHFDSFEVRVVVDADLAVRVDRLGPAPLPPRKRLRPEERHELILDALGSSEMSALTLANAIGWPAPTVRAALKQMVKLKLIRRCSRSARSPRQRYRVR